MQSNPTAIPHASVRFAMGRSLESCFKARHSEYVSATFKAGSVTRLAMRRFAIAEMLDLLESAPGLVRYVRKALKRLGR